jgi:hypothetical protein
LLSFRGAVLRANPPKVTIFAGVGAIAGAILGGAVLGFPALIASTVVFGLAGGILGAFF